MTNHATKSEFLAFDAYNSVALLTVAGIVRNGLFRYLSDSAYITMARIPVGVNPDQLASFSYQEIHFNFLLQAKAIA